MADSANNFAGGVELSQRNHFFQRRVVIEQMLNASGKSPPDVVGWHLVAAPARIRVHPALLCRSTRRVMSSGSQARTLRREAASLSAGAARTESV